MARFLDPKADLTFKRVFGEHPNLAISLLNSLLPLPEGQVIHEIEYLSPERVPQIALGKNSIVDVLCKDQDGRKFIVEMQMCWTASFKARALFNSAKVYVDQLGCAEDFSALRPVYSLNLVDAEFEHDVPEFIHHYQVVHDKYTKKVIEGLHIVFVELPKFKPQSIAERKMAVLWLKYLTEVGKESDEVPAELLDSEDVSQAVGLVEQSAYTPGQLRTYDAFWDSVRVERTIANAPKRELEHRYQEGRAEGREEGLKEGKLETARNLKKMGLTVEQIAAATGLAVEEIAKGGV